MVKTWGDELFDLLARRPTLYDEEARYHFVRMRFQSHPPLVLADIASVYRQVEKSHNPPVPSGHDCKPPYDTSEGAPDNFEFTCPMCKVSWIKSNGWIEKSAMIKVPPKN